MSTINQYIIKPLGDRYNNEKDGVIINTTNDETDFKYVNRLGEVVMVPINNHAGLEVGDKVIVHHNTFRKWFNVRGHLKDSANFIKKGLFQADVDQIFAYDRGDGWKPIYDWVFVEPIERDDWVTLDDISQYQTRTGTIRIANAHVGDEVYFDKGSEYRFEIDGKILYRMKINDLMILI